MSTPTPAKPSPIKSFFIWFFVFYAIFLSFNLFFKKDEPKSQNVQPVTIEPQKSKYRTGNLVTFEITNTQDSTLKFVSPCTKGNEQNLEVFFVSEHRDEKIESNISQKILEGCNEADIPSFTLKSGETKSLATELYNNEIFAGAGSYEVAMKFEGEAMEAPLVVRSNPVEIKTPGIFTQLFRSLISRPLFNALVALTQYMPGHSYGWAIVILTVFVRLLLFIPNQKAMKSQRELQRLQPKMAEINEQYKDNAQMKALKTMELYKTHQINPFGSILPILLQMPFLIGIFYIIKDGIAPHLTYLLYGFYSNANITLGDNSFLGLDLALNQSGNGTGQIILAVALAVVQFFAIRLSQYQAKKRQNKEGEVLKKEPKKDDPMAAMQQSMKIMMWIMPAMVAVFCLQLPAGVGIYWFTSTLFGVGQQQLVNYQLDQPKVQKKGR